MKEYIVLILFIQIISNNSYKFHSSIDNLLFIKNTSTLFIISSSHLHQLHFSKTNQTLLLLHRRVQLHSSITNIEYGVSVFVYDSLKQLLIICARSTLGNCILYDANDITRTYLLDSTIETNYLGCLSGCYTFISSNIIRSALSGNRLERNGNVINSQLVLGKDLISYNIKYQLESSDNTLITSLTFLPERLTKMPNYEYVYGFDFQDYTYYILKTSRIARLCQSTIAMRVTYDEIPLFNCVNQNESLLITGAFHSFNKTNNLFVIYDGAICLYTMDVILNSFKQSRKQCQNGFGYRLSHIIDSSELRPMCEKILNENQTDLQQCTWQPYRTNTYIDGAVGAKGELFYRTNTNYTKIIFLFVKDNIVIISTSDKKVSKFIRYNQTTLHLLHETVYTNESFNSQYVIDDEHESLIFAVGPELHQYAYNSCSLYDTCQSCIASRRYDSKSCIWFDGQCSLSPNPFIFDRGCPATIEQIQPINININNDHVSLNIKGSFENIKMNTIQVFVKFPSLNQNEFLCPIETIENNSLICNLTIPKQVGQGIITLDVKPTRVLFAGDTDISGLTQIKDRLNVYIPKPILAPDFGPNAGGTKIRIQNLGFDYKLDLMKTMKILLGKSECHITIITPNEIECINQACPVDAEKLELSIELNGNLWEIQKTYFNCRNNPMIFNWYPKTSIKSGGFELTIDGVNLDVVQNPFMKFIDNTSDYEFLTSCKSKSSAQMICLSPTIDKNLGLNPPIHLNVTFIMDNVNIIPENETLTITNDPIYFPFEEYIQEINSSRRILFRGSDLASTHSMNLINVRINDVDNSCIPLNLTNTTLLCSLSKLFLMNFNDTEGHVEIDVGTNLTFIIGKIVFDQQNNRQFFTIPYIKKEYSSSFVKFIIISSSIVIFILCCLLLLLVQRRYCRSLTRSLKETEPPQYYQDVWCELGKKWQINTKNIIIEEKIGQGCFGDVYRGLLKQSDNKTLEVAVKVSRDQNVASMHEFLYEANRMKDFSHVNVLSLVGVAWDPIRKAMVLLPFMKNGDLKSYISNEKNRPTVRQLITWGIQVADGMEYLSSLKFVHRDLATRNCMLDENLICRISDFGLSRDVVDKDYYLVPRSTTKEKDGQTIQMAPRRLPIRWLSPESIESSKYTIQSDVWSFGVLLWELLSRGKTPYPGIDNADIYTYVKNGYRLSQPTYCPILIYKSAMLVCWHTDPNQRPTFAQLARDIRETLRQLEIDEQQQKKVSSQQQSSSGDDDTTIIERYPADKRIKRLSTTSISSSGSASGQYITTPHRQSENIQLLYDRNGDDEDAYAVDITLNSEIFSTTRLLPRYVETSITEDT